MITITELYLEDVKISNIKTTNFDNSREFMQNHYIDMEDVTEVPVSKAFTFSVSGTLAKEDAAHVTFIDLPKDAIELKWYLGRKADSFGWALQVYVESCNISQAGGEAVGFDATFKSAGPSVRIS